MIKIFLLQLFLVLLSKKINLDSSYRTTKSQGFRLPQTKKTSMSGAHVRFRLVRAFLAVGPPTP